MKNSLKKFLSLFAIFGALGAGNVTQAENEQIAITPRIITHSGTASSKNPTVLRFNDEPRVTDGYDPAWDGFAYYPQIGLPGSYSEVEGYRINPDTRNNSSTGTTYIALTFRGNLEEELGREVRIEHKNLGDMMREFEVQELDKDKNPTGAKHIIDKPVKHIPITDIPAGEYSAGTPLGYLALTPTTNYMAIGFSSIINSPEGVRLEIYNFPEGKTGIVERASDLRAGDWNYLGDLNSDSSLAEFLDSDLATNSVDNAFYRAKVLY